MAKLEVKKTDVKEKSYRVIAKCPYGKMQKTFVEAFKKEMILPVFVGSRDCEKCMHFGGYVESDPSKQMFIKCNCGSVGQSLKRKAKSFAEWLGL